MKVLMKGRKHVRNARMHNAAKRHLGEAIHHINHAATFLMQTRGGGHPHVKLLVKMGKLVRKLRGHYE